MCMSQAKQSVGRRRPQQARWELTKADRSILPVCLRLMISATTRSLPHDRPLVITSEYLRSTSRRVGFWDLIDGDWAPHMKTARDLALTYFRSRREDTPVMTPTVANLEDS